MNTLEQMHFESIMESEFSEYSGHSEGQEKAAIQTAKITKQISIEFALWLNKKNIEEQIRDVDFDKPDSQVAEQLFYKFLSLRK